MEVIKFFNELIKFMESLKGTPFEVVIPTIIIIALLYTFIKWVAIPVINITKKIISWRQKKKFVIHENLSSMPSEDVYYILDHFIPTRYSAHDPACNDEPVPEYMGEVGKQQPLLVSHFLNYEFEQRHGGKFYLCLGDCGMGKTTFLVNLFYATMKKGKPCSFVSLSRKDCLEQIEKISQKEKTILFLDALDENEMAARDYGKFNEELESRIQDFYRVIITSRTNFFTNSEKEELFQTRRSFSTTEKIPSARKYYIAPFTDEDMKRYLHQRYKGKKYKQAWKIVEENKKLSVRPLILRYMDDMMKDDIHFSYSYELYEYLFRKWIVRESGKGKAAQESLYNECLILAKAMYYQWMKDGRVGIYPEEIDEKNAIPGLSKIHFQGHAMLNRTVDGMYKFAHRSYWEYLVARLALMDPVFSDDLFIRNFEQAEAFLKEMISESGLSKSEDRHFDFGSTVEAKLGMANYYLTYWKPEEAEKTLLMVLDEENITEKQRLFARIHLIRSYRYQWKEVSAERILLSLYEILNASELREELVPYYTQFGAELSIYSNDRCLKKGDLFLRRILEFCHNCSIYSYDVLRCYLYLCICAVNPAEKEKSFDEMQKLILKHAGVFNDEYAVFLLSCARIWHSDYRDIQSYECQKEILSKYTNFLKSLDAIVLYARMAISIASFKGIDDDSIDVLPREFLLKADNMIRSPKVGKSQLRQLNNSCSLTTEYSL